MAWTEVTNNSWSYGDVFIYYVGNQSTGSLIYEDIGLDIIGLNFVS